MKFTEAELKGVFIIEPEPLEDNRGFFARTFCKNEFKANGLNPELVQCSIAFNKKKDTLRGMHYQVPPHSEVKLVRCTSGAIFDVIIDLRPESPTFKKWFSVELSAKNYKMLYVPEGFAHGCQTLDDNTEVFYQMSAFYNSESERGVRWDDPLFGIKWPAPVSSISERDLSHPYWAASS